jgi:predicted O-methyltransferase YrrM
MDFECVHTYIEDLYATGSQVHKEAFIQGTQLQDFIPVVDDDVARLIGLLLRITRPRRVLEIGTSIGFSTYSMALILKEYGGQITTIEFDPVVAEQARINFTRLGVEDAIDPRLGDALEIVPALEPPYDLIFQDVDKHLYPKLLPDCLRLLRPGGLLVAEDTLFPALDLDPKWHHLIAPIAQFNQMVVNCPELHSTLLPIGDGVMVGVKRR